jgi:hypothetical protein
MTATLRSKYPEGLDKSYSHGYGVKIKKGISEILTDNGVSLGSIEAIPSSADFT